MHRNPYCHILQIFLITMLMGKGGESIGQIRGIDMMPQDKSSIEVPFEFENGFIVINVWLGGVLPIRLIFDTGAENTVIFDKELATLLGIPFERQIAITGSDLDSALMANIARSIPIRIAGTNQVTRDIIVLENNHLLLKERLGIDIHGIVGGTYFSSLVVKIDYNKQILTFYRSTKGIKGLDKFKEIDIEVYNHKPYIDIETSIVEGSQRKLRLLIDSGASLPLLIHSNSDSSIKLPAKVMPGNVGFGLSGVIVGFIGRIHQLNIDEFNFDQIVTSFQNFTSDNFLTLKSTRNGLIGNTLLARFTVILDYSKEKLYLKPNKKYNKDFYFDKSGMTVFAFGKELNKYYVVSVLEGSPANLAGVQPGDILHRINGRLASNLNLEKINKRLSGKEGKKVKITVLRNEKKIRTQFRLKEWYNNS